MSRRNIETKVYVGDLSRDATDKDIEKAFNYYGKLSSVWVASNPAGFAFVEFEDVKDAEDAVRGLDGTSIAGSRVRVEHSTGRTRRGGGDRGGGGYRGDRGDRGGGRDRGGRAPFNRDDKCYECGEHGHYAYDCPRSGGGSGGGGGRRGNGGGASRYNRSRSRSRSRSRGRDAGKRSYSPRSRSRSPRRERSPRR